MKSNNLFMLEPDWDDYSEHSIDSGNENGEVALPVERARYNRPFLDLFDYYKKKEVIGLDIMVRAATLGHSCNDDYTTGEGDDTSFNIRRFTEIVTALITNIWKGDVNPEPYMKENGSFIEETARYAKDSEIDVLVNAFFMGVPLQDILA